MNDGKRGGASPPVAVSDDDLRRLTDVGSEAHVEAGRLLIERGQHGAGLYVVLDGSVVVEAPERICALGSGACVGERALLSRHGRRTARVRAWTDVRVLAVPRDEFERLADEDPGLALRVAGSNASWA
jgi:CRP-like cAMP-binding protein